MTIGYEDADHFANALARQTCLDGHPCPPIDVALSRWTWQTDPERSGVVIYDLPSRVLSTGWEWVRHGAPYRRPAIILRGSEKGRARAFAIGHEGGHIMVAVLGLELADGVLEERWCNRFSAAWHAPADLVRQVWRRARANGERLGRYIRSLPPTALALRLGEVGVASVSIVQRAKLLYAAGPMLLPANDVSPLARLALREGRAEGDGLRAYRLSDGAERVAVMLAA